MRRHLGFLGLCGLVGVMGADKHESPSALVPQVATTPSVGAPTTRPTVHREPRQSGQPQPTLICCDVFKLTLPYRKGLDFSLEQLERYSQSGKTMLEALDKLGKAESMYSFEEITDLGSRTTLSESQKVPIVESVRIIRGVSQPSVVRLDKSCRLTVLGQWGGDNSSPVQADVSILLSVKSVEPSSFGFAEGVQVPLSSSFEIQKNLRINNGQPVLSACFDLRRQQPENGEDAEPPRFRVYIVRFQLDRLRDGQE